MPYSLPQFDEKIKSLLANPEYRSYLDIGAGAGKYGKMIREINPGAHITAVEVDKSYIKKYKLKSLYDRVLNIDADALVDESPDFVTDVAVIGDCIEHLRKSSGIDLVNYLVYRSKLIIIKFPVKLVQYAWKGHESEAHRSVWEKHDFAGFDFSYSKQGPMRLVAIKGYRK